MATPGTIGSVELVEAAGITYRQLDYWTRCHYLEPCLLARSGSGIHRRYPESEIAVARVLAVVVPLRNHTITDEQLQLTIAKVRADGRGVVTFGGALSVDLDQILEPIESKVDVA